MVIRPWGYAIWELMQADMDRRISIPVMLAPALGPVRRTPAGAPVAAPWMFAINVPGCVAALLLAIRLLPADTVREPDTGLDVLGLIDALPRALAALVYVPWPRPARAGHPASRGC